MKAKGGQLGGGRGLLGVGGSKRGDGGYDQSGLYTYKNITVKPISNYCK